MALFTSQLWRSEGFIGVTLIAQQLEQLGLPFRNWEITWTPDKCLYIQQDFYSVSSSSDQTIDTETTLVQEKANSTQMESAQECYNGCREFQGPCTKHVHGSL